MRSSLLLIPLMALALVTAACGGTDEPSSAEGSGAGAGGAGTPDGDRGGSGNGNIGALAAGWDTDFSKRTVPLDQFTSGGPSKDGIPPIDRPQFTSVDEASKWLERREPVIEVVVGGEARAYPLQILIWHEIVNDEIGGVPVAVTFCPLCNTALVFDRRLDSRVLDFGTTGNLRNSDLVMYDRQTESWWQQFGGEAVVGELAGKKLENVPARIVAWEDFAAAHADGLVLSRETGHSRPYGENPYAGYDDVDSGPFFATENSDDDRLPAKERVVYIERGGEAVAIPFSALAKLETIELEIGGDRLRAEWVPDVRSALDDASIPEGRLVGSATVRSAETGELVPFDQPFWFAVAAFRPDVRIVAASEALTSASRSRRGDDSARPSTRPRRTFGYVTPKA